jgi:hypothetical protein
MSQGIEVEGLKELLARMTAYPMELVKVGAVAMSASLNTLWEKVPPYPQQDGMSNYRRTGLLGRSLGSSMQGGASGGSPSVYNIKQLGEGNFEGVFGTNLDYAEFVIGENQAGMHSSNWWNIKTIAERAADKIERIWQTVGDKLAAFLDKKGA